MLPGGILANLVILSSAFFVFFRFLQFREWGKGVRHSVWIRGAACEPKKVGGGEYRWPEHDGA